MSDGSFARIAERVKCDLAGDPHSASRAAKAAMQRATWGRTGRIADAVGLSQRTVETWGNPSDPQRSPVQQLEIVTQTALADGAAHAEATAPLAYLNDRFLDPASEFVAGIGVHGAAADALRESSEAISRAIDALRDGTVTKAECEQIEREAAEAITALHRLTREAQAAVRLPLRGKAFTTPQGKGKR